MKILAIDTSCDETCAAVTEDFKIISNIIWSQASQHADFGGVMPSLAQRLHKERIDWVINKALGKKHKNLKDIDAIAVTQGPGLAIALEVGISKAKELAFKFNKPIIPINHIEAHLLSPFINNGGLTQTIKYPLLGLVVSGGNTQLILIEKIGKYRLLAQTVDDALGEALDKGARLLGLGYPGGAILERFAHSATSGQARYNLPIPLANDKIKNRFSYSGLKTAMFRLIEKEKPLTKEKIYNLAASFQGVAFKHVENVLSYQISHHLSPIPYTLLLGGGVANNNLLRKNLRKLLKPYGIILHTPYSKKLCGDNAAMIGIAAYFKAQKKEFIKPELLDRSPSAKILKIDYNLAMDKQSLAKSEFSKNYDHTKESEIYSLWEKSGAFTPKIEKNKKPFTVIMPPPNANNPLHIGHARFVAVEDILIRYHRMKGDSTLWLPGADHAGIETQFVFEKKLKEESKSRFDFDRDALYKMIWDYVQNNKSGMENQLKILGASCDWSRNKFTLDKDIIKIVYQTFKRLFDEGLIYRGKKLVNYCTHCGTAYSNLEVDHIERKGPLYYIKYGPFTLATTRPETIFGDTAVAVHPDDKRYKKYIGEIINVKGLIGDFKVKVIADKLVDPKFGTGVVKVTPAHDFNDYEMGERHSLEIKQVIGLDGRLNNLTGKYQGLYVNQARKQVVSDLENAGLMVKVDNNYIHNIGICYRCKNTIEPMLMEQWFLKVAPLTKLASNAIKNGDVKFAVKKFEKIAIYWLNNLKDWNISRQIVWGMQIPAWKCEKCAGWSITSGKPPKKCIKCNGGKLVQDVDTFDTWFSSCQWPYATLMTGDPGNFEYFYPTSVMETAYDILPFWVIRMIMLGLYTTGSVPFKDVVIHGLVRDKEGNKISKSKGNVIDPIEMTDKYGSDALRMALVWGVLIENDIALSEDNVKGMRNFSNKIWNAARFVINFSSDKGNDPAFEIWYKNQLPTLITKHLEEFKISQAAEEIYSSFWHKFCDIDIEKAKEGKINSVQLKDVFLILLKLLHPFAPFVTEAIWQQFPERKEKYLISASWPEHT